MTNVPVLSTQGLSKRFGSANVINDCSMSLMPGEVTLLLGKNGAGKSTLLKMCAGLSKPDTGSVTICGIPLKKTAASVCYSGQELHLYRHLRLRENIELFWSLRGNASRARAAIEEFELTEHQDKFLGEVSKGLQFRCSLAATFDPSAALMLLDEPTSSLDQRATDRLLASLMQARKREGHPLPCVLIATHDIHRLERIATRCLLLEQGTVFKDSDRLLQDKESAAPGIRSVIETYYLDNA